MRPREAINLKRISSPRLLASIISSIALSFSFLTIYSSTATAEGESVSTPDPISVVVGEESLELGEDFSVSGFPEESTLLVSISVLGETDSTISINETTDLTLEPGYESWEGISQVNFTGNQESVNSGLDSITFSAGEETGEVELKIEISEKIENTAFFDGHLYEFVPGEIDYVDARDAALLRELGGVTGYLVTITSEEEHNFVLSKVENAENIWIALSDREEEGEWVLDSGVEPEQGTLVWTGLDDGEAESGQYAEWCGGEPNDSGGEDAAVTKWYGGSCWNDLPHENYPYVDGYVAEYELEESQIFSASMIITVEEENVESSSTLPPVVGPIPIPDAGFETNNFDGWEKGLQSGTLGASINGNGTGVTIFNGSKTFTHPQHSAQGAQTLPNGQPNPYYAAAVPSGSWTFSPSGGTYAVLLQPKGSEASFNQAMSALGVSSPDVTDIRSQLTSDAQASGFGNGNPTNAAWITRAVTLQANVTYTMSWNYVGTDYVPYNDGSITSLVPVGFEVTPEISVNNSGNQYALLGFTNPGTGDYSTNSYGSTGWQISTYEVSATGTYKLGFTSFNLGDTSLSPALMVDNEIGTTSRCVPAGLNCQQFGGVVSNSPTAPTVVPNSSSTSSSSSSTSSSSTSSSTTSTTTTVVTANAAPPPPQAETPPQTTTTTTTTTIEPTVPSTNASIVPETPTTTSGENNGKPSKTTTKPNNESEGESNQNSATSSNGPGTTGNTDSSGGTQQSDGQIPQASENNVQEPTDETKEAQVKLEELGQIDAKELTDEDKSKIVATVSLIIESGINNEVAQALASSAAVLASIDTVVAGEVFASIDVGSLTADAGSAIVAAVQDAPEEIKATFETVINVFAGAFDTYVPIGSSIDVSTRRTVIAVAALTQVTVGAALTTSSSGNMGRQSSGSTGENGYARKPEEEEEGGEIESPDLRYWLDTVSIWAYVNGIRKFSMKKFLTKFWYETLALGFTLSSSIILWVTLSGFTQKIAIVATLLAFAAHFYLVMWKQQNEDNG